MAEKKKIAVIQYPGSNCEYETARAVRAAGMVAEVFRWNRSSEELLVFDGYIIPGGFSYQDRVRAGAIAAKKSIMRAITSEAEKGKPVMGICNGAQVLVETGMIPGLTWGELEMALAPNIMNGRSGYYCNWVHVKHVAPKGRCALTRKFTEEEILPIPVAHGEGRFITQEEKVWKQLFENEQVVLRYCNQKGEFDENFPINPNGSSYNIAGICNPDGNVFALMPHPERAAWLYQLPDDLSNCYSELRLAATGDQDKVSQPAPGARFFESMRAYLEQC